MARGFLAEGKAATPIGRRSDHLKEIGEEYKPSYGDRPMYHTFDITKLDEIPSWVEKILLAHPELDAVFLTSGIQRGFNFSKPESVDLSVQQTELITNYTSYVYLTHAFLPALFRQH